MESVGVDIDNLQFGGTVHKYCQFKNKALKVQEACNSFREVLVNQGKVYLIFNLYYYYYTVYKKDEATVLINYM